MTDQILERLRIDWSLLKAYFAAVNLIGKKDVKLSKAHLPNASSSKVPLKNKKNYPKYSTKGFLIVCRLLAKRESKFEFDSVVSEIL